MISLLIVIVAICCSTLMAWKLWSILNPSGDKNCSAVTFINCQFKYQLVFLIIAFSTSLLAYSLSNKFFTIGEVDRLFTTNGSLATLDNKISWLVLGTSLLISIAVVTFVMVKDSINSITTEFIQLYGISIIAVSALNALSEELIYRGALISVMSTFPAWSIVAISAIIFSLAHIKGQINGLSVLMGSGLVGGLLAFTVIQTNGLFWAWLIHFVQDVLIFSATIANVAQLPSQDD